MKNVRLSATLIQIPWNVTLVKPNKKMDITIESRLTVLENQREEIERKLNSLEVMKPGTNLLEVIVLHKQLEEILYDTIDILKQKKKNTL